jgi:hypothetical protein
VSKVVRARTRDKPDQAMKNLQRDY